MIQSAMRLRIKGLIFVNLSRKGIFERLFYSKASWIFQESIDASVDFFWKGIC